MSDIKRIKREIMSDNGAQSDTGKEDMVHARKANVAPKLTCIECNGAYRGSVTYCQNKHGICSVCFGAKKKCPVKGCGQNVIITLDFPSEIVKELRLPITCKFKKDGCDKENAEEEVIVDHEIECGYRKVPCLMEGCSAQPAMDLEAHLFSAHDDEYGKYRDNPGKWFLVEFTGGEGARKMWIDSKSGLRFMADLYHDYEEKEWECSTTVFAGKTVAKKFRAEMRLSSNDVDTSLIFNCNVDCLDNWIKFDPSKEFCITDKQFKLYNKGNIELGDHNKDKIGELTMPITVEVKMKKLNAS